MSLNKDPKTDAILKLSASLDRYELPADLDGSELNCHVNIVPRFTTSDDGELKSSVAICLVFDCSYSMIGTKFDLALSTAKMIVDLLDERHTLSLIAFHTSSDIVMKNAVPTENEKESIKKRIDNLKSYLGGSTNIASGIKRAMKVFSDGDADANIMVILSDGKPDSRNSAQREANRASEAGAQLFAVGIGDSYNADQLLRLVSPSNGAVFGDSEESRITEIFFDIIHRIDRIIATNVKLSVASGERFHPVQAFKISPERSLYDSSALASEGDLFELRLGNIADNRIHEILLKLKADQADVGTEELIRIRLQYDTYHLGEKTSQEQEFILTVKYTEHDTPAPEPGKKLKNAIRSAAMVQLADDLMKACLKEKKDQALKIIEKLERHCERENNELLQQQLDNIKTKLQKRRNITDKDLNELLLAVTATAPKAQLFDLILVAAGPETIRLVREIRYATEMGLRKIVDIIQRKNSVVNAFKNKAAAEKLEQRLRKLGAKTKINAREVEEEDEESEENKEQVQEVS
ncbi:ribosomal protein L7/L12 [Kaarinaea lacus]